MTQSQDTPARAAIYSTKKLQALASLLASLAPTAEITETREDAMLAFSCQWPEVNVRIMINHHWDGPAQVAGMKGWISKFPADERETPAVHALLRKMDSTVACLGCAITPGYDADGKAESFLLDLAAALDGFIFLSDAFYDTSGTRIIGLPSAPVESQGLSPDDRKALIEKHEADEISEEAFQRKLRSLAKLKDEGVPFIEHLPVIEDAAEAKKRTVEEIAHRAIAVVIAAVKGEGLDQATVDSLVEEYGAGEFFSPDEADFIQEENPSDEDRIKFSWRYECGWVLWWALGYVDTLTRPQGICNVPKLAGILRESDTAGLIRNARLRPLSDILDQADLIYRYHWTIRDARIKKQPAPADLEDGVVYERHYALNWLVGYMEEDWDDVSTDT